MVAEGYLCYAEPSSGASGCGSGRVPHPGAWYWFGGDGCHVVYCLRNPPGEDLETCCVRLQAGTDRPGAGRDDGPVEYMSILTLVAMVAVATVFCAVSCIGLVRTDGVRWLKERLMNSGDRENLPRDPVSPETPAEAVGTETVAPACPAPAEAEAGVPPAAVPPENPAKVAWENFLSAFRKRDVHEPFPALELAGGISEAEAGLLLADGGLGIKDRLEECRDPDRRRAIAREFLSRVREPASEWETAGMLLTADAETTYWVAGDVHAKVGAIAKVCSVIADRSRRGLTGKRNVLILLGDYVDRGDEPLETMAFIELLRLRPLFEGFEVITLKGNHDLGLYRGPDGKYHSMVRPSETADYLRDRLEKGEDVTVEAEAVMRLSAVSPRMCELTGIDAENRSRTMLFVHGGVPHVDLQERLYEARNGIPQGEPFFAALSGEAVPEELRRSCAEDFTWIRFSRDLPVKTPNRGSRGCEIGTEDVAQYLFLHRVLTSRDITFIFRGHDHERSGFACYSPHPQLNPTKKRFAQKECNVLTLNAMEPDYSSSGMFRERDIVLAEWSLGGPVRLHGIQTRHLGILMPPPVPPEEDPPPPEGVPPPETGSQPPAISPEGLMQMEPSEPPSRTGVEASADTEE